MKRIAAILLASLALVGCASNKEFYQMQEKLLEQIKELKSKEADVKLEAQRTRTALAAALGSKDSKLDAGGAAALSVAMALGQGPGGAGPDSTGDLLKAMALQRPPDSWDDKALKWINALVPIASIWGSVRLGTVQAEANRDSNLGLYQMFSQVSASTTQAFASMGPQTQNTVNIDNSQGVGVLGGTGSYQGPTSVNCNATTGAGGNGAPGGAAGTGNVAGATGGPGGVGGNGAPSGTAPVNCTVTR